MKALSSSFSSKAATEVFGVSADSNEIKLGYVFVAVRGHKLDGHNFIAEAISNGAIGLIVEDLSLVPKSFSGAAVAVENSREALNRLASQFHSHPSEALFCFGVTGTNGKTSVTYMLEHVLQGAGFSTGVLGTINHHLGEQIWPTEMTTPGPVQLQARLADMRLAGAKAVVMEVSSHALAQFRVDAVHFNTVIFTNLTRDHLDFHQGMAEYFSAKQRLFTDLLWHSKKLMKLAVVNVDDSYGRRLRIADGVMIATYGRRKSADFCYEILGADFAQTKFSLQTPLGQFFSALPMCGQHNVANAIAVIAACLSAGIPVAKSLELLAQFPGVPGRLQKVPNSRDLHVFVDYAHSPDALKNVLQSLRQVKLSSKSSGKIWTIFGCGGDRDTGKRPTMGKIANELSDQVMITSDNPRSEDPNKIIQEIQAGIPETEGQRVLVEPERRVAFEKVFALAGPQDVILIAGKGHENYQLIGKQKIRFSDLEIAQELLS